MILLLISPTFWGQIIGMSSLDFYTPMHEVTPEGASDMKLYEKHGQLKQELDAIVEEWEMVSMELEELKG